MSDKGWEGFGSAVGSVIGERLSSPLVSTFAVSWSLWNFKFFVILFSKNSVTATYALIQAECFPTPFMSFFNGLVAPLTLTMAYFYLLPVLSKIIFEEWSRVQKETKDIKQRWEDQELLGSAEALELRRKLRAAEVQIEDADFEMRKLKADGRLNDQRLIEEKEAHRVALANHKSVSEDLSKTHNVVDSLRNEAASLQDQLSAAQAAANHREIEISQLRNELAKEKSSRALEAMDLLQPRAANLLKAIAEGQAAVDRFAQMLNPVDRAKLGNDRLILTSKAYITRSESGNYDQIAPEGLVYLLKNTYIDADEFFKYFAGIRGGGAHETENFQL